MPSHRCRHRARGDKEDEVAAAAGLILAQLPGKRQVSLQAARTAFGSFLRPPYFFKGTMTGPNAPQSPGAELLPISAEYPRAR